jgi:hypothetical protein
VSTNQTVEAPNFEKIAKEAGNFTSDAINLLWSALNDTRATERRDFRAASEQVAPKVLTLSPSATVSDLDLDGASVVSFIGSSAVNFTGMRAPETGRTRVVFIQVSGSATITAKHNATSETANQLTNMSGADVSLSTGKGIIYVYLASKWREVAH